MPGIANAPRFTDQFNGVGLPFLNHMPLVINGEADPFPLLCTHALFTSGQAFGEVLGHIADHLRLANALDIDNVSNAMSRRAPALSEDFMRNIARPLDQ